MRETEESDVVKELKRVSRLLVLIATKDQTQLQDRVALLSKVGFQPKEIGDLLDTSPNIVSATLSNIKKRSQAKKKTPSKST